MRKMFSLATIVASASIFCPGRGDDPDDSTPVAFRDPTHGSTGDPGKVAGCEAAATELSESCR